MTMAAFKRPLLAVARCLTAPLQLTRTLSITPYKAAFAGGIHSRELAFAMFDVNSTAVVAGAAVHSDYQGSPALFAHKFIGDAGR